MRVRFGRHVRYQRETAERPSAQSEYLRQAQDIAKECIDYYCKMSMRLYVPLLSRRPKLPPLRLGAETGVASAGVRENGAIRVPRQSFVTIPEGLDPYSLRRAVADRVVRHVQAERTVRRQKYERAFAVMANVAGWMHYGADRMPYRFKEGRTRIALLDAERLFFKELFAARDDNNTDAQLRSVVVRLGVNAEHREEALAFMTFILRTDIRRWNSGWPVARRLDKLRGIEESDKGDGFYVEARHDKLYHAALTSICMMRGIDEHSNSPEVRSIIESDLPQFLALTIFGSNKGNPKWTMGLLSSRGMSGLINTLIYGMLEYNKVDKVNFQLYSLLRDSQDNA